MSPLTPYIAGGALLATVAAGAWVDHRGYQRGYSKRSAEVVQELDAATKRADGLNAQLNDQKAENDRLLNTRQDTIQSEGSRQQTIILKETASAPRYRDPACELTSGVFEAINTSRRLSAGSTPPNLTGVVTVPTSPAAARR